MATTLRVLGGHGVPYFTPAQSPPAGTARSKDGKPIPTLFQPIKIRGVEFHSRLFVSPIGQSSADYNGAITPWHFASLGAILVRGPGLTFVEATAVSPEGRVTPHNCGLWSDEQIGPLSQLVSFAHALGQKVGVQLSHSGRKGSIAPLWLTSASTVVSPDDGGWPDELVAPSALSYGSGPPPEQLTEEGIQGIIRAFGDAARRAVQAGVDVLEIHAAHGYLLHEFLSPVSNKRTDAYGGTFENRVRILLEVVDAVRAAVPDRMPLFVRLSATDWLEDVISNEPSWRLEDTVRLSGLLTEHDIDLVDVSSGGLDPRQKIVLRAPAYQAHFSEAVKRAVGDRMFVSAVGGIKTGHLAQAVLDKEQADVVLVARQFLKDPATVVTFAEELGVEVKLPHQVDWVINGRGSAWRWAPGNQMAEKEKEVCLVGSERQTRRL